MLYLRWALEGTAVLLFVGYLFYNKLFAGLLFFPYLFFYVGSARRRYERKRKQILSDSFKDGLLSVSASLSAGYSIENAVREAVGELKLLHGERDPAFLAFQRIAHQLSVNITIEEAFTEFAQTGQTEEIHYFSEVLNYAKRSGGNLIQIVRDTASMISDKIEVRKEILTITTAKQFEQNIMNIIPLAMILYMRLTSASMMDKLYGNPLGIGIMTGCLLVYYLAKKLADYIVNIPI